ncbi:hypothetical protein AG1IA_02153 [Rhizoctonia solani AG-1 IA]|uniref:Uncharacterized protein n=2 Tax=Rhizoctonia solani TaxID=456999 RepID=A0A8H8T2H8_9AGAM|nr:uncharacterized protein RhiXN_01489 [Rhizoctonia solani]ELU43836.1 hypothetical protein AG1IA_02153 [Rhizoctonia solani AG-1 IA]QRW26894.1 hypothetical protein RhiXN_01489 [Rhizoctonia solani]
MASSPQTSASSVDSAATYDSIQSYNNALHEYTRNLWMEARREAESRSKNRATQIAPLKKSGPTA